MYVYLYVHVCMSVGGRELARVWVYVFTSCVYVFVDVCMHTCTHESLSICMHVCTYVLMNANMSVDVSK